MKSNAQKKSFLKVTKYSFPCRKKRKKTFHPSKKIFFNLLQEKKSCAKKENFETKKCFVALS